MIRVQVAARSASRREGFGSGGERQKIFMCVCVCAQPIQIDPPPGTAWKIQDPGSMLSSCPVDCLAGCLLLSSRNMWPALLAELAKRVLLLLIIVVIMMTTTQINNHK